MNAEQKAGCITYIVIGVIAIIIFIWRIVAVPTGWGF